MPKWHISEPPALGPYISLCGEPLEKVGFSIPLKKLEVGGENAAPPSDIDTGINFDM